MLRTAILWTTVLVFVFAQNSSAADVDFDTQIKPIFMQHCAGCHGEEKGLGKLRLHTPEAIQKKAADDDHLIVKGKPDESELYERLVLPADHKKRMPKKADPLPKEKIELIRQWIEQGAVYKVTTETAPAETHDGDHAEPATAKIPELPLPEVAEADAEAIEKLTAAGGQVTTLYSGSPLLQVSFALRGDPATDDDLALLAGVAEQVYSLNLAKAQISDQGLAALAQLKNLSKLHLENSSVADSGLAHLSGLTRLEYLNLYGTSITDAGLEQLADLKHLRNLYVWQTKISYDAAQAMEKSTAGLSVNLGFDHPVIVKKRVTKQLKQAQEQAKETEAEFNKAKAAFERVQKDQEAVKKRVEELQKELAEIEGKDKPEAEEKKPAAEEDTKKDENKV